MIWIILKWIGIILILIGVVLFLVLSLLIGIRKAWVHTKFYYMHIPFQIFALTAFPIAPIAVLMYKWKWNPLGLYMDPSRYSDIRPSGLAKDYEKWLDDRGAEETWRNLVEWHWRNRMWKAYNYLGIKTGSEYIYEVLVDTSTLKDEKIIIADEKGYIRYENSPGLKFINKQGEEGWDINSGVKISWKHTILGIIKYYFKIGDELYFRYSKCVLWFTAWKWIPKIGGKDIYYTFKFGAGRERYVLSQKVQWEKS